MAGETNAEKCTRCGGERIISGLAFSYAGSSEAFQPTGFNKWKFAMSSTVKLKSFACRDCGFVWKAVNPTELADFIKANCE